MLIEESTLTERYQNTIPAAVRKALHLEKGDKVRYTVTDSGEVRLSRVEVEQVDPVVGQFLSFFLASDMQKHPDRLEAAVTPALKACIDALVGDVDVGLDSPLLEEDD